jgi:hypothetical protein
MCSGATATGGHALVLRQSNPARIFVTMNGNGLQGVALGVMIPRVSVSKHVASRVNASDSFDISATTSGGAALGSATTGAANNVTAGPYVVAAQVGTPITLSEVPTPGSGTSLTGYTVSWSCTNNGVDYPVTPSADGTSVQVTPAVTDDIACTVTNSLPIVGAPAADPWIAGGMLAGFGAIASRWARRRRAAGPPAAG